MKYNDYNKISMVYYPAEILRVSCKKVEDIDEFHRHKFFNAMKNVLNVHDGLGLAAPQVGFDVQIILISPPDTSPFFLINPEFIPLNENKLLGLEGCLSLPEIFGNVIRHELIGIRALDEYGNNIEIEARDLTARIIQHEIDHLHGRLFKDIAVNITEGKGLLKNLESQAHDNEF